MREHSSPQLMMKSQGYEAIFSYHWLMSAWSARFALLFFTVVELTRNVGALCFVHVTVYLIKGCADNRLSDALRVTVTLPLGEKKMQTYYHGCQGALSLFSTHVLLCDVSCIYH